MDYFRTFKQPGHVRSPSAMSTIESTVTRLLVATKQLLESLTQWSKGEASEHDVSDVYVVLGNEFNVACRAFLAADVDVTDLGDVPQALRVILERALSEDASQQNLDRHLPSIREIIVNLLRQLKVKQTILRGHQRPSTPTSQSQSPAYGQQHHHARYAANSNNQDKQPPTPTQQVYHPGQQRSVSHSTHQTAPQVKYPVRAESLSSRPAGRPSASLRGPPPSTEPPPIPAHTLKQSDVTSARSGSPVAASVAEARAEVEKQLSSGSSESHINEVFPVSKKESAFAALQKSEALERRASRRFSAYQFAKLANRGNGVPDIPPLPASDALDSARQSMVLPTKASHSSSPADYISSTMVVDDHEKSRALVSPSVKLNSEHPRSPGARSIAHSIVEEEPEDLETHSQEDENGDISGSTPSNEPAEEPVAETTIPAQPISVFLQLGKKTKKFTIEDAKSLTIQSLRLHFIEVFAYAASATGFPQIYILDPNTNVRYELEDAFVGDITEGTLLALNIDEEDDIRTYFAEGLNKLTKHVSDLNQKVADNAVIMKEMKDQQQKQMEAAAVSASAATNTAKSPPSEKIISKEYRDSRSVSPSITIIRQSSSTSQLKQIDSLRKDVAVIHQVSKSSLAVAREQLASIIEKTQQLQEVTNLGSGSSSRGYMESCHKKLSSESDELLTRVDDIQDIIEDMRRDVAQRGVRHSQRQIKGVSNELFAAIDHFEKMEQYLNAEKPTWKKIWEKELETVCEEQQFFKLQEELVADLRDDLEKARETFSLVEACAVEQSKGSRKRRPTPPTFKPSPVDGIVHAKDAVLSEVSALKPNHEARVEAIERAEKMRERERKMVGGDEFENELHDFVKENKLKKSGGIEEAERRRKLREIKAQEEARLNEAEIRAIRQIERAEKRREREEAAANSVKTDSAISSASYSSADSGLPDTATIGSSSPELVELKPHEKDHTVSTNGFGQLGDAGEEDEPAVKIVSR